MDQTEKGDLTGKSDVEAVGIVAFDIELEAGRLSP